MDRSKVIKAIIARILLISLWIGSICLAYRIIYTQMDSKISIFYENVQKMFKLRNDIIKHHERYGSYPEDLKSLDTVFEKYDISSPWLHKYEYANYGTNFLIVSYGSDNSRGGSGDKVDVFMTKDNFCIEDYILEYHCGGIKDSLK